MNSIVTEGTLVKAKTPTKDIARGSVGMVVTINRPYISDDEPMLGVTWNYTTGDTCKEWFSLNEAREYLEVIPD